jgi:hypothetical protein
LDEESRFRKTLLASHAASESVGEYYRGRGYDVSVPPLVIRPTFGHRHKYGDKGDVHICKNGIRYIVEVKHRPKIWFTGAHDYPYSTINIDRVAKKILADMYVVVSADLSHAAFLSTKKTRHHWSIEVTPDNGKGYTPYRVYRCHKTIFTFKNISSGSRHIMEARG